MTSHRVPPESLDRFAARAARLSGQCALILGWRPDEFWAATPAELAAIFAAARPSDETVGTIGRADLQRMMEHDDG